MMRIGKNESPLATQRGQLVGHLRNDAEAEKTRAGNAVYWKASMPFSPRLYASTFVAQANSSIIASRMRISGPCRSQWTEALDEPDVGGIL